MSRGSLTCLEKEENRC